MKKIIKYDGYTIAEMLIAVLLTGILAASGAKFYISMHNQTLSQEDISDMQHNARVCMGELTKVLRMAGYKVGTHPAYDINGDTLRVFYSETQPVDTLMYYLTPYADQELPWQSGVSANLRPMKLMKRINSLTPDVFAEQVRSINYNIVDSANIVVTIQVQADNPDEDYNVNQGIRTYSSVEKVNIRNLSL